MTDKKTELAIVEDNNAITPLIKIAVQKLDSEGAENAVAVIERLVDLKLKVDAQTAKKAFFTALVEFQEACPHIKKTSEVKKASDGGSKFGYKYAELDEIEKTIRPHIYSRGLSFNWDTKLTDNILEVTCTLRHKDGYETTSSFSSKIDTSGRTNTVQQYGTTRTYLMRYTLVSILGLTTTDPDTDGAPPKSLETITAGQADELEAKVIELGMDKKKLLKFFDAEDYTDIRKADHKRVIGAIDEYEEKN